MAVWQAAETFGWEHGLVITTVSQMMERLRKKGVLEREQVDGVWTY
jgi:predicted transcriptional regulator